MKVLSDTLSGFRPSRCCDICRVDCDIKSDARTEKEKVKGDIFKRTSAELKKKQKKKQVKNSFIVVLWQAVVQGPNCRTELVESRQHDNLSW